MSKKKAPRLAKTTLTSLNAPNLPPHHGLVEAHPRKFESAKHLPKNRGHRPPHSPPC